MFCLTAARLCRLLSLRNPGLPEVPRIAVTNFWLKFGVDKVYAERGGAVPQDITMEDKTLMEQVKMIQELEEKDRNTIFNIIDTMLTKAKFKDFFNKNIAAL